MSDPKALCPSPACGLIVKPRESKIVDKRERPWHEECASRALADYFRTPVDVEILAGEKVEFLIPSAEEKPIALGDFRTVMWAAPYKFFLHEVQFLGDFDLDGIFVGNRNAVGCLSGWSIVTGELSGQVLPVGMYMEMSYTITMNLRRRPGGGENNFSCRIVGERTGKARIREDSACLSAMSIEVSFNSDHTGAGDRAPPIVFRAERIACDDWEGLEVVRVEIGGGPGRSVEEMAENPVVSTPVGKMLTGRVTELPCFTTKLGEFMRFVLRDHTGKRKSATLRVYGQGRW